jgi:2-amino-4-hydroxy-6-hydroxymethyldihydropteridine diphosphokinase
MGRRPLGKSTIYSLKSKSKVKKKSNSRYTDRPIDIDILLYDDLTVDEPDLKIPHPLMHQRDFVMIPLNEIRQ